jgi:hypothetical protein
MKRFTTLLLGTTLAAALSFGAQTNSAPAKAGSSAKNTAPTTTKAKKAKKHHKHSTSGSHSMMPMK